MSQRRQHMLAPLAAAQGQQRQGQLDVLVGRQHRQQVVGLKDVRHVFTAPAGEFARAEFGEILATDDDIPGGRRVEPAQQIQKRGLAGSGRPHQRDEIARVDRQTEVVQRVDVGVALVIELADVAQFDDRLSVHAGATPPLAPRRSLQPAARHRSPPPCPPR